MVSRQSNEILTAIVHGMKKDEPSDYVRLAATNALLNSLEFTKANFDNEVIILPISVHVAISLQMLILQGQSILKLVCIFSQGNLQRGRRILDFFCDS